MICHQCGLFLFRFACITSLVANLTVIISGTRLLTTARLRYSHVWVKRSSVCHFFFLTLIEGEMKKHSLDSLNTRQFKFHRTADGQWLIRTLSKSLSLFPSPGYEKKDYRKCVEAECPALSLPVLFKRRLKPSLLNHTKHITHILH